VLFKHFHTKYASEIEFLLLGISFFSFIVNESVNIGKIFEVRIAASAV